MRDKKISNWFRIQFLSFQCENLIWAEIVIISIVLALIENGKENPNRYRPSYSGIAWSWHQPSWIINSCLYCMFAFCYINYKYYVKSSVYFGCCFQLQWMPVFPKYRIKNVTHFKEIVEHWWPLLEGQDEKAGQVRCDSNRCQAQDGKAKPQWTWGHFSTDGNNSLSVLVD